MSNDYPYMMSNIKISPIFEKVKSAAKPPKFTHEFLKHIGHASSNDRAIIPLLKKLGFLTDDGTPTAYYDQLRDPTQFAYILGERIKALYSDLFTINTNINSAPDDEIKGAFSRITGKDDKTVSRFFLTFKTLAQLAKFDDNPKKQKEKDELLKDEPQKSFPENSQEKSVSKRSPEFHYNIQIHLPATTDISVYNAIFKSLKEHLNI